MISPEHGAEDEQVSKEGDQDEDDVEADEDEVPGLVEAPVQPVELHQVVVDGRVGSRHGAKISCMKTKHSLKYVLACSNSICAIINMVVP